MRMTLWIGVSVVVAFLCSSTATGRDEDVTSRDIEQAFRTIRRAIHGGAEEAPFGRAQALQTIEASGGTELQELSDNVVIYRRGGRKLAITFYDDGGIQLSVHLSGGVWDSDAANAWNAKMRIGKCYVQDGDTIVLECALLYRQGPSAAWFQGGLDSFHGVLPTFYKFVAEQDKDEKEGK